LGLSIATEIAIIAEITLYWKVFYSSVQEE